MRRNPEDWSAKQLAKTLNERLEAGGARDAGQAQQRLCGGHEWLAPAGQARSQRVQDSQQLYRYRVFAYVQAPAFAAQPVATGHAAVRPTGTPLSLMLSSSTQNDEESMNTKVLHAIAVNFGIGQGLALAVLGR